MSEDIEDQSEFFMISFFSSLLADSLLFFIIKKCDIISYFVIRIVFLL